MSLSTDPLPQARQRISELEKSNQTLQHQLELANNELSHKNAILSQTNSELTEMQSQYKQVLQKLAELNQRPPPNELTSREEALFRSQLREQSLCISALQNRVWQSEHQNRLYRSQCFAPPTTRCQCCQTHCILEKRCNDLELENQKLRRFAAKSYKRSDIENDRRRHAVGVLRENAEMNEKYDRLKQKYDRASDYLGRIQSKLDRLTQTNEDFKRKEEEQFKRQEYVREIVRRKKRRNRSEEMSDELDELSRITKDLRGDYQRIRKRFGRDLSIEELAELNASF
jgi:hypothetical protein